MEIIIKSELKDLLKEVSLTPSQLQLYIYLLKNGPRPISDIVSDLKKDRGVVYKYLESLMKAGLVEKEMSKNVYTARPLEDLKRLLTEVADNNYKKKRETIDELIKTVSTNVLISQTYLPPEYRLIYGRKKLYRELKALFNQTYYEYRLIMSGNGLLRSIRHGLLDSYLEMVKRGVKVFIISEVNEKNVKEAQYLYDFIPFKHEEGLQIRLNIFDNDKILLGAIQHDEDMSLDRPDDSYILIQDKRLAKGFTLLFENLWKNAKDAGAVLKRLSLQKA